MPNIETPLDYNNGDYATLEVFGYTVVVERETGLIYAILGNDCCITESAVGLISRELDRMRDETEEEIRNSGMGWARK